MEIEIQRNDSSLAVVLSGSLDTTAASELEEALTDINNVQELLFDLAALEHISSAGLRTLLILHKKMAERDGMKIRNVPSTVMDIFEQTGFTKFLAIEN